MKSLKYFIIEKKSTDKEREEFFKKNDELSDSDPDAYKDAPGDEEARKAGKVKKSKHTKNYHDLYSDDEKVDEAEKASDKNNKEQISEGPLKSEKMETALKNKAKETGVYIGILRAVARRGLAAWNSSHRKGAGQEQWALARVNSFLTKGEGTWGRPVNDPTSGADSDMAREVIKRGEDAKLKQA